MYGEYRILFDGLRWPDLWATRLRGILESTSANEELNCAKIKGAPAVKLPRPLLIEP